MDFAPEPVLDAFTPPPTRAAPRAPATDESGQTFEAHLDAVSEPAERPAPTQSEAKDEASPPNEAARAEETTTDSETLDADAALLGGPAPSPPPPMAAPVVVQIAASQPQQTQTQPQSAATDVAPVTAPAPIASNTDAVAAAPVAQSAPATAKHADVEVKPAAATDAAQPQAQAPQTTPNAQQTAQPQQTAPAIPTAAPIESQELPEAVQQAIAQTIAPVVQAPARPTLRSAAKGAAPDIEAKPAPNTGEAKPEAAPANTNVRTQAPKTVSANAPAAIEPLSATAPMAATAPDAVQFTQSSAATTTAAQASTHVQHAAADTGAQRAAPAAAQVGREIIRRFEGGNTSFEIRLDPPELGRVEVRMEVSRDHRVSAVIAADSPQALTELARHARELEQQLQAAGLQLSENGLSFDLRQGARGGEGEESDAGARGGADETANEQQAAPAARPIGYERWRGVRVDMMV